MEQGNQTIKDLADQARARAIEYYGGATFAKMCLEFEASLEPAPSCDEEGELSDMDDYEALAEAAIKRFATTRDAKTMQLCLIWLDGHGWGSASIETLYGWASKYRKETR